MYDAVIMKSSILLIAWGTVVEHLQSVCGAWVAAAASHHALLSSLCLAHATERVALTKVVKRHFFYYKIKQFYFPFLQMALAKWSTSLAMFIMGSGTWVKYMARLL